MVVLCYTLRRVKGLRPGAQGYLGIMEKKIVTTLLLWGIPIICTTNLTVRIQGFGVNL